MTTPRAFVRDIDGIKAPIDSSAIHPSQHLDLLVVPDQTVYDYLSNYNMFGFTV